ncbi:hypothetical protein VL20_1452 [Microcystis panniformis FACHB-1757]|uniref:Uncharacterized protein n=1 Tax=Microcystis panniformis FACHB-1757 TaxID=1638788 RepID=A0A0K1RY47_9CHRO|nr:hypothetical protein VL20_1452 [Microcystis panniformis FACHB-1757]
MGPIGNQFSYLGWRQRKVHKLSASGRCRIFGDQVDFVWYNSNKSGDAGANSSDRFNG